VIVREEVMELLVTSCASFGAIWDPAENIDDGERLLYLDAMLFDGHVLDLIAAGDTTELDQVFDLVERLHLEGDDFVRELATIGILEGLHPDEVVRPWLRPTSLRWWSRLDQFWGGDRSALLDVPGDD
jgi:hypothetical protein